MIDIHCHILPGVDDGSPGLAESLEMARMAADSGVTDIIATPHCNLPGQGPKNYRGPQLEESLRELQEGIRRLGIPLRVHPGAEVFCTPELPELLREQRLLTLNGSRYLLTEFFFDESLVYMDRMLAAIWQQGLTPVLAHPERYDAVQQDPYIIRRWFESGYLIQMNKGSLLGRLGHRAQHCARWLLERGLIHLAASDAHRPDVRTPHMKLLWEQLEEDYSTDCARLLLEENPRRILMNRPPLGPGEPILSQEATQ